MFSNSSQRPLGTPNALNAPSREVNDRNTIFELVKINLGYESLFHSIFKVEDKFPIDERPSMYW